MFPSLEQCFCNIQYFCAQTNVLPLFCADPIFQPSQNGDSSLQNIVSYKSFKTHFSITDVLNQKAMVFVPLTLFDLFYIFLDKPKSLQIMGQVL